jgi:hypothetical protein
LALESELSPRLFKEQQDAIQHLGRYAGTKVTLEYLDDVECKRTAEQIAFVLAGAKWTILPKPQPNPDIFFRSGVEAGPASTTPPPVVLPPGITIPVTPAGILIDELNKTGIDADPFLRLVTTDGVLDVPEGTVLVRVGAKPTPEEHKYKMQYGQYMETVLEALRSRRAIPPPPLMDKKRGTHFTGERLSLPNSIKPK